MPHPSSPIPLTVVDAFAEAPFSGNPAAVCLLDAPADAAWMQRVAAEMNLSETAFVVPQEDGFGLRWFTPTVEVDLCGHATLAAAHVLFETGTATDEVHFETASGRLTVRTAGEAGYTMDFPATPPAPAEAPVGAAEAFGRIVWAGRSVYDLFLVLPDEATVRALAPDADTVRGLTDGARGLIVTAQAEPGAGYDVVSRFFAPAAGVDEDPVTGSAHCALGPYWAGVLGRDAVRCFQASRRGGAVGVRVVGDRAELTGRAVTVFRAALSDAAARGAGV